MIISSCLCYQLCADLACAWSEKKNISLDNYFLGCAQGQFRIKVIPRNVYGKYMECKCGISQRSRRKRNTQTTRAAPTRDNIHASSDLLWLPLAGSWKCWHTPRLYIILLNFFFRLDAWKLHEPFSTGMLGTLCDSRKLNRFRYATQYTTYTLYIIKRRCALFKDVRVSINLITEYYTIYWHSRFVYWVRWVA